MPKIKFRECEGWDSNPWTPSGVDLKSNHQNTRISANYNQTDTVLPAHSDEVSFTLEELDSYVEIRSRGREQSTARTLSLVRNMLWEELNGSINQALLSSLSNAILTKYQSESSIHKFFMYSRGFIKHLYKMRMDMRLHAYYSIFEKPKVRREKKLMTSRIITEEM